MAPAKPSKTVAATGKDLRSFFGGVGGDNTHKARTKSDRTMMIDSDDIPPKKSLKRKNIVVISTDEEGELVASPPKKKAAVAAKSAPKVVASASTSKVATPKAVASVVASASTKAKANGKAPIKSRKSKEDEFVVNSSEEKAEESEDDYEDEEDVKPEKKGKTKPPPRAKPPPKKRSPQKAKATGTGKAKAEDAEPPSKTFKYANSHWAAAKAAKLAGPSAPGSKQVPQPKSPNCLEGLAFVFTGELSSFSRDEATDLAKRFGGRVVLQPSSRTSFVVLGENAGPSKLNAINKHRLKTLSEDEFLNLIATREGPGGGELDEKTKKKVAKEQETIKQAAKELERREKQASKDADKFGSSKTDVSSQLWTTRYAPQSLKEICGNKGQVEKLQLWLHDWSDSLKCGFKKPGKNAMNVYRAVMITGPPGIGKTTSAHLCAKLEGFTPIELNASDARSKKLVESGMNISNLSLDGWMGGNDATNAAGVRITDKTCLIMDEVDGMSAGDRGGVGALNALIKKTKIPIICIANDRGAQKLKPLIANTFGMTFRRPEAQAVRSRIMSIAYKEKMKIPANVIDQLITGSQSDIRQVLNMLSTWRLSSSSMDFDEAKNLAKINEKYTILTPFDVTYKILGPYAFGPNARETLGDKMELYFHDHSFVPLFIQENYLKTQPVKARNLEGPPKMLKQLELMDQAASSISDADLVDALIHGPEQHWSLMPLHAVCSMVRPASFLFGAGGGYGGQNPMTFPQWLGQNSKQNKLSRQLGDVQVRMRLRVSGDKSEIRQSYIPALYPHVVKPLIDRGAAAVDDVIERMDEYYLSREDWDTVVELGVDAQKDDVVNKLIKPATKTSFTKKYNSTDHPIPFHKATDLGKVPKKLAGGPAPDLEDVFDLDDEVVDASDDEKKVKDEDEVAADKLFQASKPKTQSQKGKTTTITGKVKSKKAQNFM
ncbi:replication factor RFC1 C terminal domain-containing protein [Suillus clintonianus]|uniref:replication factor RFC1 C terminal domain-containing protein n=1 Tax=Suillus clintonianus TaxID=1904413 RepID=UPI001B8683F2|nr:replication factor RFC1 C terminal domain-containing protein [Suillus clintonianus]KAG2121607.1 replication factor RFC1 C terminal domain-containing protein [Suillus clintonianus]